MRGQILAFPDGEPLEGVQVLVRDPQGRSAATTTDADGAFEALGVEPGLVRVQAVPPAELNRLGAYAGDVSAFCAARTFALEADSIVADVLIELPVGGTIQGDVVGVGPGAVVKAQGADTLNLSLSRTAVVDAQGGFEVTGLASWVTDEGVLPGAYVVSVSDGHGGRFWHPGTWDVAGAELVAAVRGEVTPLDLSRPEGTDLQGCLVDPEGNPHVGATVSVRASEGTFGAITDVDGCFALLDLPGVELTVTVDSEELAWTELEPVPGGGAVDIGAVTVSPEASVVLSGIELSSIALVPTGADAPMLLRPVDASGRAGRLPAGAWDVLAPPWPTADWLPARIPVALTPGGEALVPVAPEPAGTIEVAVLRRTDGFGLRGATVETWGPEGGLPLGRATSSEGVARFVGLPRTPVVLRAAWEPFCPADPRLVPSWSGGARDEPFADELAALPDSDVTGPLLTFRLAPDRDRDAMDDVWELLYGLPIDRPDGAEDPDGDGLDNLSEYRGYTDPRVNEGLTPGCSMSKVDPTCVGTRPLSVLALLAGLVVGRRRRR